MTALYQGSKRADPQAARQRPAGRRAWPTGASSSSRTASRRASRRHALRGAGLPLHRPGRRPRPADAAAATCEMVKDAWTGPVLLHVVTERGTAFEPAVRGPGHVPHAAGRSRRSSRRRSSRSRRRRSKAYTDAVSAAIYAGDAATTRRSRCITAAMCQGNKLEKVRDDFPDRFFDIGHLRDRTPSPSPPGMAKAGAAADRRHLQHVPAAAFDQIFQEVALQNLPVVFMLDRAGLTGPDGPTHHGVFDIAVHAAVPEHGRHGPRRRAGRRPDARLRPRARRPGRRSATRRRTSRRSSATVQPIELGQAEVLEWGDRRHASSPAARCWRPASQAAERLREREGLRVGVINARFVKPLDTDDDRCKAIEECGVRRHGRGRLPRRAASARPCWKRPTTPGLDTRARPPAGHPRPLHRARRARRAARRLGLDVDGITRGGPGAGQGRRPADPPDRRRPGLGQLTGPSAMAAGTSGRLGRGPCATAPSAWSVPSPARTSDRSGDRHAEPRPPPARPRPPLSVVILGNGTKAEVPAEAERLAEAMAAAPAGPTWSASTCRPRPTCRPSRPTSRWCWGATAPCCTPRGGWATAPRRCSGVNAGRLGFLADLTPEAFLERLGDLADRRYTIDNLMTLACTLIPRSGPDPDLPRPQRRRAPRRAVVPPARDRPVDRRRERDDLPGRRPDRRHAGRLDGAQPLGGGADPAAERAHVRRHADLRPHADPAPAGRRHAQGLRDRPARRRDRDRPGRSTARCRSPSAAATA